MIWSCFYFVFLVYRVLLFDFFCGGGRLWQSRFCVLSFVSILCSSLLITPLPLYSVHINLVFTPVPYYHYHGCHHFPFSSILHLSLLVFSMSHLVIVGSCPSLLCHPVRVSFSIFATMLAFYVINILLFACLPAHQPMSQI